MTNEEAIAKLEVYSSTNGSGMCTSAEHLEAKKIAIKALEKQIAEKPNDEFSTHAIYDNEGNYLDQLDTTTFRCPACNHILASGEISITDCVEIHYCEKCGKAIDWGEDE